MRKSILIAVAIVAALSLANTGRAEDHRKVLSASDHANVITATWRCQDKIPIARTINYYYPWVPHSQSFRADQINKWTLRLKDCRDFLKRRAYEWHWEVSLPYWAIRLASCESSLNWWAEGSSSDGVFYSAFNISRSQYDKDAHYMGVRGWHEGPGVPSPVEQTWAVIGHMRLLGDGFTGRCHGIAHSTWE